MMRILNILVIGALVAAAAYVYKGKFESTRQAERLAKLRMEIRQEQDAIASLRAEWSKLDTPARIQELAKRHLEHDEADRSEADRHAAQSAGASARSGAARRRRPDRLAARKSRSDRGADDVEHLRRSAPQEVGHASVRCAENREPGWHDAGALAPPSRAHPALRQVGRPVGEGARPHRARHRRVRALLRRHRRAAGDVRRNRQHHGAPLLFGGCGCDRAPRHPRPQRRDPRHRRAHALAVRRAASHRRQGRGGRAARDRDPRPRRG